MGVVIVRIRDEESSKIVVVFRSIVFGKRSSCQKRDIVKEIERQRLRYQKRVSISLPEVSLKLT